MIVIDARAFLALFGVAALAIGVFLPVVAVPLLGSKTIMGGGERDGIILLCLAALALALILIGRTRYVVLPGAAALGLIIYNYVHLQSQMDAAQKGKIEEFGDEPLRKFVEAYAAEFSYGWIVMGAGALILILASFVKLRAPTSSAS
jgi:hypothetical protein